MNKKTTAKKISLSEQIKKTEDSARKRILAITTNCEKTTGRPLKDMVLSTSIPMSTCSAPPTIDHFDTLRQFVKNTGECVRLGWEFESPCSFIQWAEPIFVEGWNGA